MTKKRRAFDIDMPDDVLEATNDMPGSVRRGPMATAIVENVEARTESARIADVIRQENDELAHEFVALREAGHVVQNLPMDEVHSTLLVRDRIPGPDEELEELVASISEIGLSNPIRVIPRTDGQGYELVQGQRRLQAYRQLRNGKDGDRFAVIPALVISDEPDTEGLWRRMVDENIVRKDLSFAEMALTALNFAKASGTKPADMDAAVAALFKSSTRQKRNHIRRFAELLEAIGDDLEHPTAIPRDLGLRVVLAIKERPEVAERISRELRNSRGRDASAELEILRRSIGTQDREEEADAVAVDQEDSKPEKSTGKRARTKTTFHIQSSAGQIKCTAGVGRLEIRVDRDFSAIDRHQLEQAVTSLIDGL